MHLSGLNGSSVLNCVYERGAIVNKRHMQERGTFSVKYGIKGQVIGPRGKASPYKILFSIPLGL